jgi:transketolase
MNAIDPFRQLEQRALCLRKDIVQMSGQGGCFLGAAFSCLDLILYLYDRLLRVTPESVSDPDRDVFLLSKGHAVPALYAVLAERGFFPRERLLRHLSVHDHVYWHPHPGLPGVEFQSGSLGHLLSVGMGMALDARLRGSERRVFVLLGDGELNEGSIWEGLLVASAFELSNLVLIVDRNRLQANVATEELIPLEPLGDKLSAFGCSVQSCDGHAFWSIERAFRRLPFQRTRPSCVIANTLRGKGLPSLEGRPEAWFVQGDVERLGAELERAAQPREPYFEPDAYSSEFDAGGPA